MEIPLILNSYRQRIKLFQILILAKVTLTILKSALQIMWVILHIENLLTVIILKIQDSIMWMLFMTKPMMFLLRLIHMG